MRLSSDDPNTANVAQRWQSNRGPLAFDIPDLAAERASALLFAVDLAA